MTSYLIEPEVAGGLGPGTVMDRSTHPPRVDVLEYQFAGWMGDDLLEAFPCYVITERLAALLEQSPLTGYTLADLTVTTTDELAEHHPGPLPSFRWLQVTGRRGVDDLWLGDDLVLQVTPDALDVLRQGRLDNAVVEASD